MSETNVSMRNGVEIDSKKVQIMLFRLLLLEKNNSKTHQFTQSQMLDRIQKIIEEEISCL